MFLICFSSAGVLSCALRLAFRALFDAEHRLHAHMLARRDGARPKDMLVALLSSVHALARAVWQRCRACAQRSPPPGAFRRLEAHSEAASMAASPRTTAPSSGAPTLQGAFRPLPGAQADGTGEARTGEAPLLLTRTRTQTLTLTLTLALALALALALTLTLSQARRRCSPCEARRCALWTARPS